MYVRKTDITTTKITYDKLSTSLAANSYSFDLNSVPGPTSNYKSDTDYFVWDGIQPTTTVIGGIQPTTFDIDKTYVHCEHPDLYNGTVTINGEWIDDNTTVSRFSGRQFGDTNFASNYYQQCEYITGTLNAIDRSNKISFRENDKFLLGSASCGCYLYLSPIKYTDIRVSGNDAISTKPLNFGTANAYVFQIVYQYRMTDYFGPGVDGIGRIGGDSGATQVEYRKIMGLDIFYDDKKFGFDIEVISRYKSNSISTSDVPTVTFQNTINQTTNNVNQLTPSIS